MSRHCTLCDVVVVYVVVHVVDIDSMVDDGVELRDYWCNLDLVLESIDDALCALLFQV